jgi:hypothetical protein
VFLLSFYSFMILCYRDSNYYCTIYFSILYSEESHLLYQEFHQLIQIYHKKERNSYFQAMVVGGWGLRSIYCFCSYYAIMYNRFYEWNILIYRHKTHMQHCQQIQLVTGDHVAMHMTHQQSTTRCATKWTCYCRQDQCDMVKCQHSKCSVHPKKITDAGIQEHWQHYQCIALLWNPPRPSYHHLSTFGRHVIALHNICLHVACTVQDMLHSTWITASMPMGTVFLMVSTPLLKKICGRVSSEQAS